MIFQVQHDLGFRVQFLGFRVSGSASMRVKILGLGWGLVVGLGFRV